MPTYIILDITIDRNQYHLNKYENAINGIFSLYQECHNFVIVTKFIKIRTAISNCVKLRNIQMVKLKHPKSTISRC